MYNTIKNHLVITFIFLLLFPIIGHTQLVVTPNQTATVLANTLAGSGSAVFGATLTCPGVANGTFTATGTLLAMSSGIILTNGHAASCAGPEGALISFNDGAPGDPALAPFLPAGTTIVDACYLEFNIVATGDTLSFNYQFGSEEYRNAVCSIYTDVFAFFISGPGIVGVPNMALVPGTNIPVEINSINNGTPGVVGGANIANCHALGAGSPFTTYYLDNTGGTLLTYRGYTTKLRAFHAVTPCDTYHLKLSIVDAGNALYDSGVFLEAASLHSNGVRFDNSTPIGATINGIPHSIVKGCSSATIGVISTPASGASQTIHFTYGGTGVYGIDYTSPDSVTMPAGDTIITFNVNGIPTPPGGTKTVTIYVSGGCSSDSITINVMDTPSAQILTPDTAVCGASVLIRTTGTVGLSYLWTPTTGLSSATIAQPTATPTVTTTFTMTATLPGSGCPPIIRTITISVGAVGITISADTTICLGNSVNIIVGGSPTFSYLWAPPTGLSSTTVQNPIATPTVTTTYSVTATLPGSGCTPASQQITIAVVTISDSILTQDTTICLGASFTLRAVGTPGLIYNWSPATGLSSPSISDPLASPLVTTTYVLTGSMPGCPSLIKNVHVTVESTSISIGPDTTLCQSGVPYTLSVTGSPTYTYSWAPATGLSNPNIQYPIATPSSTTIYTVTATLPGSLCPSYASETITILGINPITMNTPNQSICLGDTVFLSVNGSGSLNYLWTPAAGLNNPNIPNPQATPTITTTYIVTASGPGGACPSNASVTINVSTINAVMVTPDTGICVGESVQIIVNGDPTYIYNWTPAGGLDNPNTIDPIATPGSTTTYTFTASNGTMAGCTATGQVKITVSQKVSPWLKNPVLDYCQNTLADTLTNDVVYGQNLTWYNGFYDTIGSPVPPIPTTTQLGTYFYYVAQAVDNCNSLRSTIIVNVIPCCEGTVFVPSSFSPNNDGLNDYFTVKRPVHMAIDEIRVFDRWGTMVFFGNGTNDKWDGTYNGKPCEMGVYFYYIQYTCTDGVNGVVKFQKGDITLLR